MSSDKIKREISPLTEKEGRSYNTNYDTILLEKEEITHWTVLS